MAVSVKSISPSYQLAIYNSNLNKSPQLYSGTSGQSNALVNSVASIDTTRRIGEPGTFEIQLYPVETNGKSWDQLLMPMDYVDIKLSDPNTNQPVTVMRGFINSIRRSFDISSGTPREIISVQGMDWHKIAMIPIYYFEIGNAGTVFPATELTIWNRALEDTVLGSIANETEEILENTLGTLAPISPSTEIPAAFFIKSPLHPLDLMDAVYQGFFRAVSKKIVQQFSGANIQEPAFNTDSITNGINTFEAQLQTFHPIAFMSSDYESGLEVTIWDLFTRYQNRPWRELYFDDFDGPPYNSTQQLIYKAAPWQGYNGGYVTQPPPLANYAVSTDDYTSYDIRRSDNQVFNLYMTKMYNNEPLVEVNTMVGSMLNSSQDPIAQPSTATGPLVSSDWRLFGNRTLQFNNVYLDWPGNTESSVLPTFKSNIKEVAGALNQQLSQAFSFNELLEEGTITLLGSPAIHIGNYIDWSHNGINAPYYVEGVHHSFKQPADESDGHFLTTLTVTRGRGYFAGLTQ